MPYSNLILPLISLFYRMWRHFALNDSDTPYIKSARRRSVFSPAPVLHKWREEGEQTGLSNWERQTSARGDRTGVLVVPYALEVKNAILGNRVLF